MQNHTQDIEAADLSDILLYQLADVDFQDEIIRERHDGIVRIQRNVTRLRELFQEVTVQVERQGDLLDHIETRLDAVVDSTRLANSEIRNTDYSRNTRLSICLFWLAILSILTLAYSVLYRK